VVEITEEQVDAIYNSAINTNDPFAKELYCNLLKAFDQPLLLLKLVIHSNLPLTPLVLFQSIHDCLYLKKTGEIAKIIDAVVEKLGNFETHKLLNQTLELEQTVMPGSHKPTFDQVRQFILVLN